MPARTSTDGLWGRTIWSSSGFGSFVRQILPSSLQGGEGGLRHLRAIWDEKSPEKKFRNVFRDTSDVY